MRRNDIDVFGSTAKSTRHAADIVAALTPPPQPTTQDGIAPATSHDPAPTIGKSIAALAPGLAGAATGAYFWKKHRVLGALAGHALASNAMPLYNARNNGKERTTILCRLGTEGAGIGGSLLFRSHPILGWVGGMLAGLTASSFVSGTPLNDLFKKVKADWTAP